eukprot:SAG31_NODE_7099_length_1789_cov_1.333728_3_plen_50_part_00
MNGAVEGAVAGYMYSRLQHCSRCCSRLHVAGAVAGAVAGYMYGAVAGYM